MPSSFPKMYRDTYCIINIAICMILSYREVTVSLQPYKQSDQGLHFWFDILSASFGCISISFLISVYSNQFNMRFGLWKKDLFTIQAKNYARRNGEEMGW